MYENITLTGQWKAYAQNYRDRLGKDAYNAQQRPINRKSAKAYRERVAKDPAKKAASRARHTAGMFYKYHREGPPKKRFASPCELADWKLVHVRKYKDLLDAAYPDGIPSGGKSAHLSARYALLKQRLGRSS